MNRVHQIAEAVKSAGLSKFTIADLGLDAQVSLAYQCARSAHNAANWWEANDTLPNSAERRQEALGCLPGLFGFLQSASHYVEAVDTPVDFVIGDADPQVDVTPGGHEEVLNEIVAVKRRPHAWARDKLIASGVWPMQEIGDDGEVGAEHFRQNDYIRWFNLDKAADRELGRFLGSMAIAMADDKPRDTRNDGKLLEICTQSPACAELAHIISSERRLTRMIELSKKSPPFVNNVPVDSKTLMAAWRTIVEMDEDDADADEMRTVVRSIQAVAREAKLLDMIQGQCDRMEASGIHPDMVAFFRESSMLKLAA